MKLVVSFFLTTFISLSANAATLKCQAADSDNKHPKAVDVLTIAGAELTEAPVTKYGKYDITVVYQAGDRFDRQTSLSMTAGDFGSRAYDVNGKGAYVLSGPGLFLQCWFE